MISAKTLLAGLLLMTTAGAAAGQQHGSSPHPAAGPYSFRDHILPILRSKCEPCHFEGGKVFAKLPFSDSAVVLKLGARLNTRLKDSTDQAVVLSWSAHSTAK